MRKFDAILLEPDTVQRAQHVNRRRGDRTPGSGRQGKAMSFCPDAATDVKRNVYSAPDSVRRNRSPISATPLSPSDRIVMVVSIALMSAASVIPRVHMGSQNAFCAPRMLCSQHRTAHRSGRVCGIHAIPTARSGMDRVANTFGRREAVIDHRRRNSNPFGKRGLPNARAVVDQRM